MDLLRLLANTARLGLFALPLPVQRRTNVLYDLLEDLFAALTGGSGMLCIGARTAAPGIAAAQAALARRTVRSLPPAGTWLDVGCGVGGVACLLATELPQVRITGLNPQTAQLHEAGLRRAALGMDRVCFVEGDACAMPFAAAGGFDGVYCLESAFHYPDKAAFAREAARMLRPGGRFACADLVLEDVDSRGRAHAELVLRGFGVPHIYGPQKWRRALDRAGFDDIACTDISRDTLTCLDRWIEALDRQRADLMRIYPPAVVATVRYNMQWLLDRAETGPVRYVLLEATR